VNDVIFWAFIKNKKPLFSGFFILDTEENLIF